MLRERTFDGKEPERSEPMSVVVRQYTNTYLDMLPDEIRPKCHFNIGVILYMFGAVLQIGRSLVRYQLVSVDFLLT